jgi:uncharacterized protein
MIKAGTVKITVGATRLVSGLLLAPPNAAVCLVLAHGAGAGMTHPFMEAAAVGLGGRGIATLRYQFPFMEQGTKRPDSPQVAGAAVRAAVAEAARLMPEAALFAGGKSFGARMTSQAQAESPLPSVRGLVFLGFPLHPAGKPADERALHLARLRIPMLFLQGTRDALADPRLLRPVVERLGSRATLVLAEQADHSFHVPKRSGTTDQAVLGDLLDELARWMTLVSPGNPIYGHDRYPGSDPGLSSRGPKT